MAGSGSGIQVRPKFSAHSFPDGEPLALPARLGDFEIQQEVGRGGMGIVYRARQLSLARDVAIKVLPFGAALDQRWLKRFKNEIRTAAQLNHPNIVPFFEVGNADHVCFYAMYLVRGVSLAKLIAGLRQLRDGLQADRATATDAARDDLGVWLSPLLQLIDTLSEYGEPHHQQSTTSMDRPSACEPKRQLANLIAEPGYHQAVARWAVQALDALDYAHGQGILHLDIKPSNLLLDTSGRLWITDFSAARSKSGADSEQEASLSGTLSYMSPEQAFNVADRIDLRSDLYSLGATLYELLTLERPYACTASPQHLPRYSRTKPDSICKQNRAVPKQLERIVFKAMAANPEQRYASAGEMRDQLRGYLDRGSRRARDGILPRLRSRASKATRWPSVAALITAAILVCAGLMYLGSRQRGPLPSAGWPMPIYQWNGHYYTTTPTALDWHTAEEQAVLCGGHLVAINSKPEQEFLEATFLSTPYNPRFWIGLTDEAVEGSWRWTTGEPLTYENWNPGFPNHNGTHSHNDTYWVPPSQLDYAVINWANSYFKNTSAPFGSWNDFCRGVAIDAAQQAIWEFESDPRARIDALLESGQLSSTLPLPTPADVWPTPVYEWNGRYYTATPTTMDWHAAERNAVAYGGHLVAINDKDEQQFIQQAFLPPPNRESFWIGLTDHETPGVWRWTSGEPVTYTDWESGEPNNGRHDAHGEGHRVAVNLTTGPVPHTEDYVLIDWHFHRGRRGTWNDYCSGVTTDVQFRGIWEFTFDPRVRWARDRALRQRVYTWGGHYYALTSAVQDWHAAEREARTLGGHLVSINDQDEQAFLEETFLRDPQASYWIGLTDRVNEGAWQWTSGEPLDYQNWAIGEPNNVVWEVLDGSFRPDEDYAVLNWRFRNKSRHRRPGTWNDFHGCRSGPYVGYRGIMEFAADPRGSAGRGASHGATPRR